MAKKGANSSPDELSPNTQVSSPVEELLLAAQERGSESLFSHLQRTGF
jgi:hypothetical protein